MFLLHVPGNSKIQLREAEAIKTNLAGALRTGRRVAPSKQAPSEGQRCSPQWTRQSALPNRHCFCRYVVSLSVSVCACVCVCVCMSASASASATASATASAVCACGRVRACVRACVPACPHAIPSGIGSDLKQEISLGLDREAYACRKCCGGHRGSGAADRPRSWGR